MQCRVVWFRRCIITKNGFALDPFEFFLQFLDGVRPLDRLRSQISAPYKLHNCLR